MDQTTERLNQLIGQAQAGDEKALGQLLDEHRDYLRLQAQRAMDGRLAGRIDASDIVQQTYLSAVRRFDEFDGKTGDDLVGWLYRIHERNLIDAARHHLDAQKRSVDKEHGAVGAETEEDVELTSPSQRLMLGESAVRLARAIGQLPDHQAEAIRLRHLDGWSIERISEHMEKTERAIAGLLHRGLESLRSRIVSDIEE
jgi:RNA polymerase sigma-70 factor, ECF subfamily